MTDNNIIKALECEAVPSEANCIHSEYIEAVGIYCHKKKQNAENCHDCEKHRMAYYGKRAKATLDLINRQKAEIERLKAENNQFADIGKMHSEIKAEAIKKLAEDFEKEFFVGGVTYSITKEEFDEFIKRKVDDTE